MKKPFSVKPAFEVIDWDNGGYLYFDTADEAYEMYTCWEDVDRDDYDPTPRYSVHDADDMFVALCWKESEARMICDAINLTKE